MDLAKGIRAFISGREMILSLMVDTFIIVLNRRNLPGDESRRTYQGCAAVFVIYGRPAPHGERGPAPIKRGLGCQSQCRRLYSVTIFPKCHQDQSNFLANCVSSPFNAERLMVLLHCVTCRCFSHIGTVMSRKRGRAFV